MHAPAPCRRRPRRLDGHIASHAQVYLAYSLNGYTHETGTGRGCVRRAIDATMPAAVGWNSSSTPASNAGPIVEGIMKYLLSSAMFVALLLGNPHGARAQTEVTLIAPGGVRTAIEQLIPGFEQKTGYKVKATFG